MPSGSYVVDILNPNYVYEPVRVEINNKGKFRARKVNVSRLITRCTAESLNSYRFLERSAVTSPASALSAEVEGSDHLQILPAERTVEDHGFPVLADGSHDDPPPAAAAVAAQDHERPRDQKGNGEPAVTKAGWRHARRLRDAVEVLGRWSCASEASSQQQWRWKQGKEAKLNELCRRPAPGLSLNCVENKTNDILSKSMKAVLFFRSFTFIP